MTISAFRLFNFTRARTAQRWWLLLAALLVLPVSTSYSGAGHDHAEASHAEEDHAGNADHDEHDEDDDHDHDEHEHEEQATRVEMSAGMATQSGVKTAAAGAGTISRTLLLYGKLVPDPQHVSHVRARFPGLITQSYHALGDNVKAGEPVLEIEANESLRRYRVQAPISGVVVESHANAGELAGDQPLLTIANHDKVWLELSVFARDARHVRAGQTVSVRLEGRTATSRIAYLNPGSGETPYLLARVPIANQERPEQNGAWLPGMMAEADVILEEIQVPLRVDNRALQQVRADTVVFVRSGNAFDLRPLQLGRNDGRFTEVLSGLNSGEQYVVENSYLLKADLEKSGAAHDH